VSTVGLKNAHAKADELIKTRQAYDRAVNWNFSFAVFAEVRQYRSAL
jgi:hypothetical protein